MKDSLKVIRPYLMAIPLIMDVTSLYINVSHHEDIATHLKYLHIYIQIYNHNILHKSSIPSLPTRTLFLMTNPTSKIQAQQ